ncbi:MAG TPA: TetR/AcrR family transcriptional regulator [bacterium]|nr:TetR/AcrR family transcriptional regulator [bacterium]
MSTPARPQRLSFSERERIILEAAGRLFAEKGFVGTTTKAIATESGVNEALLFRHFRNKEELYNALIAQRLGDFETELAPALKRIFPLPAREALIEVAKLVVQRNRENSSFCRIIFFAALENHQLGEQFFKQRLPLCEFLEGFFADKIRRGEIQDRSPQVLSRAFIGTIQNYVLVSLVFNAPDFFPLPEAEMLEAFVDIFLKGVQR